MRHISSLTRSGAIPGEALDIRFLLDAITEILSVLDKIMETLLNYHEFAAQKGEGG